MSDVMKRYRKPDGYTIKATEKAFHLFYEKQGFKPVEEKVGEKGDATDEKTPIKAAAPLEVNEPATEDEKEAGDEVSQQKKNTGEKKQSGGKKSGEKNADAAPEQPME